MATVDKNAGFYAAQIGQDAPEMDAAMNQLRGHVARFAAESRATGQYMDGIQSGRVRGEQGRGKQIWDRAVWVDDPGVLPIEFGHEARDGTHVAGKYIFSRARDAMG